MKILFYRYGSICEPDIIEGFAELGVEIDTITKEITDKDVSPQECIKLVSDRLFSHPADGVFTINFYPAISEVCQIFHLPYLCWIVDSPVMELYTKSIQNPCNRVFLFDRAMYEEIAPLNPTCVFHLPLATNVKQKDALLSETPQYKRDRFASDVSFIGSLYTEKCAFDRLDDTAPPYLRGYLNGLMEAQLKIYGYYFIEEVLPDEIVAEFKTHFPYFYTLPGEHFLTDRRTLSQLYIGTKITVLERDRLMRRLPEHFPVTIYTGSDTAAYPKLRNRGLAKTLTEMPLIFHESAINLNITAKSIRSALPLRIWDILGSGGFCISNYQSEIAEQLVVGEQIETYESFEDLEEKIAYYREHESRRREIAQNGYEEVKAHHTYPIRLAQMLNEVFR